LIVIVGAILVYVVVGGAIARLANDAYHGREINVAEALGVVGRRLAALIVAALLKAIFYFLGALVFFFGVLYPLPRFFAVAQAIVLEGRGVGDAFARSGTLSQNLKLHIIGTLVLLFIINAAVSLGVSFLLAGLGNRVLQQVLTTIVSIFVYPLYGIG